MHNILSKLFQKQKAKKERASFGESISSIANRYFSHNVIHKEEREILRNIITFGEIKVSELMVPRTDIIAISIDATASQLKDAFVRNEHTRVPVYTDTMDDINGFVHIMDFVPYIGTKKSFCIDSIMRNVIFIPKTIKAVDLFAKMRRQSTHLAIVLDEYGGTEGLVTIEDLLEEVIGDIKDEHDKQDDVNFVKISSGMYKVSGRADIEELEDSIETRLLTDEEAIKNGNTSTDFETFNGFVLSFAGKIPKSGDKIKLPSGIKIQITKSNERRIIEAILELPKTKKKKLNT